MTRSCQVFPFTICNKSPVIFLYTRDIYIFYQKKLKPQWVTAFQAIGAFNKNSKFLNDCLTRVENMCLSKVAPFSCTLYVLVMEEWRGNQAESLLNPPRPLIVAVLILVNKPMGFGPVQVCLCRAADISDVLLYYNSSCRRRAVFLVFFS